MKKVNLLSRAEMKKVLGGVAAQSRCTVTNTNGGGTTVDTITYETGGYSGWTCDGMMADTAGRAATIHAQNGGSTHYDCGCDGWGV